MKKVVLSSVVALIALGSCFFIGEQAITSKVVILEDVPMSCPKCGKFHKPTGPCQ